MTNNQTDSIFSRLNPVVRREIETWVVNSVKVKMIKKMDNILETEGKVNIRKLFLVPIFSIPEMTKRVQEQAPELKTLFYKELFGILKDIENRFIA